MHGARPPGINEPTPAGVEGAREILCIVESLGPDDVCLCLISGGGSALLPAPVEGITLEDKLAVTRHLSGAGANIQELNAVRKQLSRIKGGGLARACRAGRLVTLIISDVLGDPLDVIASGPTVPDSSTPEAAMEVLDRFHAREAGISPQVLAYLQAGGRRSAKGTVPFSLRENRDSPQGRESSPPAKAEEKTPDPLLVIGNNATAVDAAGREAERLGYSPAMVSATQSEGPAEEIGRHMAAMAVRMRDQPGPDCLVSGGEPVVRLVEAARRGLGGRNQQLVLAALEHLAADGAAGIVVLSGGTDGEDGPTDAAGALCDAEVLAAARARRLDPGRLLGPQRRLSFLRAPRGPYQDRPDAHECL